MGGYALAVPRAILDHSCIHIVRRPTGYSKASQKQSLLITKNGMHHSTIFTLKRSIKAIAILMAIVTGQFVYGQTDKDKAVEKEKVAIQLIETEKVDESIFLLEEAQKLDPTSYDIPYELAYAHYLRKEYIQTITILEKIENHKDVTDRLYQLLGNSYDTIKKGNKAVEVYEKGLKKFPNSGYIYLESGILQYNKREDSKALNFFEKGIEVAPELASNYYWAAKIFCNSTEEVWGMIYGELFMNLERNSERTAEISKLLFDTYKNGIRITGDYSFSVSFSKNSTININDRRKPETMKLPFGSGVYEQTLMSSMLSVKSIDMHTLDSIRSNFVDNYYLKGYNKTYPNILFSYQKKVKEAGYIEAYNHWILMKGDEYSFDNWLSVNKAKWESFRKWFNANRLTINSTNKFFRGQY